MLSKLTGKPAKYIFSAKILNKFDVKYYQCEDTDFIFTEEPYWLEEAYSSAITKLDLGLPMRNEYLRDKIIPIINHHFNSDKRFLDYAGGYGLFTRMMRDKGFDFYHTDKFCDNLFAEYFSLDDINQKNGFEVVTAFEVFEHLSNPMQEIGEILSLGNNLLFTTELQPQSPLSGVEDWWYFIPETGQHISFYTKKSLQFIAAKFGFNFYTDNVSLHLFSKEKLMSDPFIPEELPFFIKTMKRKVDRFFYKKNKTRETLLQRDWQSVKDKM